MNSKLSSDSDQIVLATQQRWGLFLAAAIASGTGLATELLLGTLASYLAGNQALSYGLAIGIFLAALGLGSYLSQFIASDDDWEKLLIRFCQIELVLGPLIALLPLGLFGLFVWDRFLWLGLGLVTLVIGTLAGLEIPLLVRILERQQATKQAISQVLALDYLGALVGSLLFPTLLLPLLGMFPSAALLGTLPPLVGFGLGLLFPELRRWGWSGLVIGGLLALFIPFATQAGDRLENSLYDAPVVYREQSAYQRIVLTRWRDDLRLFLDGDLQFSSFDEYRYHEALVHPALSLVSAKQVLVLGAGDGLALREILKYPNIEQVILVELDPSVVRLAKTHPRLSAINHNAFSDPRVNVIYGDAFRIAPSLLEKFDLIVADFPDPDQPSLAKLYSQEFYQQLRSHLTPNGVLATQATSPFFAPKAYQCIAQTLHAAGFESYPYQAQVPSFGPWGFILASLKPLNLQSMSLQAETQYLTPQLLGALFLLPGDLAVSETKVNRLTQPTVTNYLLDRRWDLY
ncbi:MAG: polyamine aminopropyltransferase [Cyanobacteria bacterium P01_H01_bin.15]